MATSTQGTGGVAVNDKLVDMEKKREEEKAKILNQMEFYFGDSNYPRDKFLQQEAQQSPDNWVSLDKICNLFNRMKQFKDRPLIIEALRESKELIEVNEDGTSIRRKAPVNSTRNYNEYSLYVKGFPTDRVEEEFQKELEEFFKKESQDKLRRVTMRRDLTTKKFKGSVFVEVEEVAQMDEICSKGLKFNGQELIVMKKLDYIEKKKNEKAKKSKDEEKAESLRKENVLLAFKGVSVDETDRSANRKIISEALNTLGFAVSNVYFCNTQENEEGKGVVELSEAEVSKALEESQEKLECGKWVLTLYLPTEQEENEYWEFREKFRTRSKFPSKRKSNFSNRKGKKRTKTGDE